jgi:psp operon transcriptional activator
VGYFKDLGFTEKAKRTLLDYDWPGNVRELKNVVERAVYKNNPHLPVHDINVNPFDSEFRPTKRTKAIQVQMPAANIQADQPVVLGTASPEQPPAADTIETNPISSQSPTAFTFPMDLKQASQDHEIALITAALENAQFNQKKTAEKLSLTYHQLRGYLKKYNLLDKADN